MDGFRRRRWMAPTFFNPKYTLTTLKGSQTGLRQGKQKIESNSDGKCLIFGIILDLLNVNEKKQKIRTCMKKKQNQTEESKGKNI